jgi:Flp pilus assembly protein TadD
MQIVIGIVVIVVIYYLLRALFLWVASNVVLLLVAAGVIGLVVAIVAAARTAQGREVLAKAALALAVAGLIILGNGVLGFVLLGVGGVLDEVFWRFASVAGVAVDSPDRFFAVSWIVGGAATGIFFGAAWGIARGLARTNRTGIGVAAALVVATIPILVAASGSHPSVPALAAVEPVRVSRAPAAVDPPPPPDKPLPPDEPQDVVVADPIDVDRGQPRALGAVAATASRSSQPGRTTSYGPENVLDGAGDTVWQISGGGPGEWIAVDFPGEVTLARIGVVVGYDKILGDRVGDRWPLNNRVRRARIEWQGGQVEWEFADERGLQWVEVGLPQTSWIRLTVLAVRPGQRWNDTSIAEIVFEGWPEDAPVAALPAPRAAVAAIASGVLPALPPCPPAGAARAARDAVDEGRRLENAGRIDEAMRAYERAIEADPSLGTSYSLLSYLYLQVGRPDEAVPLVLQSLGCVVNSSKNWMRLGDAFVQVGRDAEALAAYDRALEFNPEDAATIIRKGSLQWMIGDHDGARDTWRPACERRSRAACSRIERGFDAPSGASWRAGWGSGSAGAGGR